MSSQIAAASFHLPPFLLWHSLFLNHCNCPPSEAESFELVDNHALDEPSRHGKDDEDTVPEPDEEVLLRVGDGQGGDRVG